MLIYNKKLFFYSQHGGYKMQNIKKYISTKKVLKEIIDLNISTKKFDLNKIKFAREGIIITHNSVNVKELQLPEGWRYRCNLNRMEKLNNENKKIEQVIEIFTV